MEIILTLVGGLILFLYGVGNLSDSIKEAANDKMKKNRRSLYEKYLFGDCRRDDCDDDSRFVFGGYYFDDCLNQRGNFRFSPSRRNRDGREHRHDDFESNHRNGCRTVFAGFAVRRLSADAYQPKRKNQRGGQNRSVFRNVVFRAVHDGTRRRAAQGQRAVFGLDGGLGKSALRRGGRSVGDAGCSIVIGDGRNGHYAGETKFDYASGGNRRDARRGTRNLFGHFAGNDSLKPASDKNRRVSFVFQFSFDNRWFDFICAVYRSCRIRFGTSRFGK